MIEKDRWYSLSNAIELGLFPMFKSSYVAKEFIKLGKLKAIKTGEYRGTRYKLKGEWIIDFIAKWESGDF